MYTYITSNYTTSSTRLEQGVKNGATPKNAVAGGNGSFLRTTPASFIIKFQNTEDGNIFPFNASNLIRNTMRGLNLTEKRCNAVADEIKKITNGGPVPSYEKLIKQAVINSGI